MKVKPGEWYHISYWANGPTTTYINGEKQMADTLTAGDVTYTTYPGAPALVEAAPVRDVVISKASNGFIVRIGCKTLVSRTWKEMSAGLDLYFKDPVKAQRTYCQEERPQDARPQGIRRRTRRSKKSKR